ncbi:UDP-glucose 4-epimerase protein [Marine Group I thaumarchaeote SCGC AAA799-E16]|uniref:UDP-glucose 4-epimerase protein n=2 Tax=Marine Group I TaxID=905826 RepID=A0A087S3E8_9ARCH|nr:UDP-glucose 4-epimerase protein [Marine Group I thaumarchaeote SCGC AAA799-E16]KFM20252.1 UDP-glucose 4-epimerase protein [Marine Group I thaumarchaeote SCGC RSA3]
MKYAVTGGAGFVGSHIVKKLNEKKHEIVVIDNLNTGKPSNLENIDNVTFVNGDIRDFQLLRESCKSVDGIFHQAALASVPDSFEKPEEYHEVNVKGTENIFKIGKEFQIKIVYASSSSVYGNPIKLPITEDHPRTPLNPYGKTKVDDEKLAEMYSKEVKITGLRYFNIFGENQSMTYAGVITKFLENIRQGQAPKIFGDGTQLRDFIYVGDVVDANLKIMESDSNELFLNVGTGKTTSIKEMAEMMIKISGLDLEPIFLSPLKGDVKSSQADITLIQKTISWKPRMELKNWLEQHMKKSN